MFLRSWSSTMLPLSRASRIAQRFFASEVIPKEPEIRERVRHVMSMFERIDKSKVLEAAFTV